MIKTGNDVLFQEPTCDTRRLRRSVVVDASADEFSIQFVAEPFAFEVDQEVLMYFNGKREFMQQIARVTEVSLPEEGSDESITFALEAVGDPISAENRQHYRVSTISANLEANVGDEENLSVQDLSSTGFAVLATNEYELGQTVEVSIAHGEEQCHGIASIQSVRDFGGGRIRYGMRAIEEDPHTGEFLQVLQRISLAVQREQLQRSGGASA
ncbi:MAG: hypothetical protein NXI30_17525 [bacterium]|nr:hypothetical protein [bacterium]